MTLANAHALFCGLKSEPSYLANLAIDELERKGLMDARRQIRSALKDAAKAMTFSDDYWQDSHTRQIMARNHATIQIKFMTQGSFAYKTLNAPAQKPNQEIDLDDGMYVPVHFLSNGEPALAAKGLFRFVEQTLLPLCRDNGWTLDISKENCVRVKLWPGAHVDIPIYSVPQDQFEEIVEAIALESVNFADSMRGMARDAKPKLKRLPTDKIMLAQRDGTWIQSDPKQLHDWVMARVERYGPVYQRLCRFFKGWRDFEWAKPRLSSICIMCAVDEALRRMNGYPTDQRDDELIMNVAKLLPEIFDGTIPNPVIKDLCLNSWDDDVKAEILAKVRAFRDEVVTALEHTGDARIVVETFRRKFGDRIRYRPDAVKINSKIEAIRKAPAATVAAPVIIPSTSG
ncbi:CBASS cGAMP synthase [Novosphingobium sp.]|uniref:CBASS cGAMP synthase n=1 Tax=Novosphingobium sp. TaxID=1874826 RepID=UPI0031D9F790